MKKPRRDPESVREAAVSACAGLLFNSGLDSQRPADLFILRGVLNHLVWYYSETHDNAGKYSGCPRWSEQALNRYNEGPGWQKHVALEHVFSRKQLVSDLLEARTKDDVRSVLARSETCVVLRVEHDKLPSGEGWDRYAGIKVVRGPSYKD
jgi:hypothetical protein